MKISRTVAVGMLVALGFTKASEWSEEKLLERLQQVPEKVKPEELPGEYLSVYEKLKAVKGEVTFEVEEHIDPESMDLAALRSLVEERKLKVSSKDLKDVAVARVAVKKALRSSSAHRTKSDRALDRAAVAAKKATSKPVKEVKEAKAGGKTPSKETKEGVKGTKDKEVKAKETKIKLESDRFGARMGSIKSAINLSVEADWVQDTELAKKAGVTVRQARGHLRQLARDGHCDRQRWIAYRLKKS